MLDVNPLSDTATTIMTFILVVFGMSILSFVSYAIYARSQEKRRLAQHKRSRQRPPRLDSGPVATRTAPSRSTSGDDSGVTVLGPAIDLAVSGTRHESRANDDDDRHRRHDFGGAAFATGGGFGGESFASSSESSSSSCDSSSSSSDCGGSSSSGSD